MNKFLKYLAKHGVEWLVALSSLAGLFIQHQEHVQELKIQQMKLEKAENGFHFYADAWEDEINKRKH